MNQTLFSKQDLAKRWGFSSTKVIENYEQNGIIKRVPKLPTPRYSIYEIEKVEAIGMDINPLSPLERRRLEKKVDSLEKELNLYKEKLGNIKILVG
jgi:hypothetical protein